MTDLFSPSETLVKPLRPYNIQPIYMEDVMDVVSSVYDMSPCHITSRRQTGDVTEARHLFCWLARELTPNSLPEIGRALGGRDHSTISYNLFRADELRKERPDFLQNCKVAKAKLRAGAE